MTDNHHRPAEVIEQLQISPSTLRRWSQRFARFLSDQAGNPSSGLEGGGMSHRRYTDQDIIVLERIKLLLAEGYTYDHIERRLELLFGSHHNAEHSYPVLRTEHDELDRPVPAIAAVVDTLHTVADGQQAILNSQQANRELLGVVVQDNFNLKVENARLRERMLTLERDMVEMQRREEQRHERLEERVRALEQALAHLQQQLAALPKTRDRRPGLFGRW